MLHLDEQRSRPLSHRRFHRWRSNTLLSYLPSLHLPSCNQPVLLKVLLKELELVSPLLLVMELQPLELELVSQQVGFRG